MAGKTDESKKAEANRLWREEKLTQKQIADRLGAGERTVRRWLADEPRPNRAKNDNPPLASYPALLALTQGSSEAAGRLFLAVEMARRAGNTWLPQFLTGKLVRLQRFLAAEPWAEGNAPTPEPWDSLIVGLPLLGEAIGVPSLADVAQVIDQYRPWEGRGKRRAYYRAVNPRLFRMYREMAQWSAVFGPTMQVSLDDHELDNKKGVKWQWDMPRDTKDVLETLGGKLMDLLSTLPAVDRDKAMLSWRKLSALDALVSILASMEGQSNRKGDTNG
jgi:transcriptional regulator with XRE-family HTH domain